MATNTEIYTGETTAIVGDPKLNKWDRIVVENISGTPDEQQDRKDLDALRALNDPKHDDFQPTVFASADLDALPVFLRRWLIQPYIGLARSLVRVDTDVIMVTHLLLYFTTSVPSAIYLFHNFSWTHGIFHIIMQLSYMGAYTLLMHQHIHVGGILKKRFALLDKIFPYILDPLMGHTFNTFYWHHVKAHHVEGNGPNDLSSTIRFERDNAWHFAYYTARFFFLAWLDLPLYFLRKGHITAGLRAGGWEVGSYMALYSLYRVTQHPRAFFVVFLAPLLLLRLGLMVNNWGQHAFVDDEEPDSDYRSSITVIDTKSNRYGFNQGYHTSHHLNPHRHWRDHPASFLKTKEIYACQKSLVFYNINFNLITVKLLKKDYEYIAKHLVPMDEYQKSLSMEDRIAMLKRLTRPFTEEQIRAKFRKGTYSK